MDLSFFRIFRAEDAQRLSDALEKAGTKVYRSWRSGASICATPEEIKPCYLTVDGSGEVSVQDPVLSHPSMPHLTPLGTVDLKKKNWALAACLLYVQSRPAPVEAAASAPVAEAVPVGTWTPAVSAAGPIPELEVTPEGEVRRVDGNPVKWDLTRPSRIRLGSRHLDVSLPDVILCTFVGPPPTSGCRATYKDTILDGTVRKWAASNLKWSDRRPSRPVVTEEQVQRVFDGFSVGKKPAKMAVEMHISATTVSAILRLTLTKTMPEGVASQSARRTSCPKTPSCST